MSDILKNTGSTQADNGEVLDSVTFRRQLRSLTLYLFVLVIAKGMLVLGHDPFWQSLGLGMMLPGAGFLNAIMLDSAQTAYASLFFSLSLLAFAVALFLWFATGNALAPPLVWLLTALLPLLFQADFPFFADMMICSSGLPVLGGDLQGGGSVDIHLVVPLMMTALVVMVLFVVFSSERKRQLRLLRLDKLSMSQQNKVGGDSVKVNVKQLKAVGEEDGRAELSLQDLQRIRLLLDRALQPVDQFEGFEWRDQFQTASVRFQVNALSYALSMVQYNKTPAFTGYLTQAQHNLAAKMLDHRVWGYWRLENLWGNLKASSDPIAEDTNIMLTGFYGLQLSMFQAASGIADYNQKGCLTFAHPGGKHFDHDQPHFLQVLKQGHQRSAFGLMPCEPNWIYPLCNIMSVSAMSIHDKQFGSSYWQDIRPLFSKSLERDFLTSEGKFITLVSSYTGLSLSHIGGAIMQAFPLFFLSQSMPEMARLHWQRFRADLMGRKDMRTAFWPFDVGNYSLSRAAGYVATAATAVEMGDQEVAQKVLGYLGEEHPSVLVDGVSHRPKMSLWAHCYEVLARSGGTGVFARMGEGQPETLHYRPHIATASYPEILVAKAVETGGVLEAVFYPGKVAGQHKITVDGLTPGREYLCRTHALGQESRQYFRSCMRGRASLSVLVDDRTTFLLEKA